MERQRNLESGHKWLCERLGVEPGRYPLRFAPDNSGWYHAEPVTDGGYDLIVTERGRELSRERADTLADALYVYARAILAEEGTRQAASTSPPEADQRRASFAFQLEAMTRLCPEWHDRLAAEQQAVLAKHPFTDTAPSESAKRGWIGVLVVAALLTLWLTAHWPLWSVWRLQSDLAARGLHTDASITRLSESDGKFMDTWRVEYRFSAGGRRFASSDEIWLADYWRLENRETVPVLYDPRDPARAMVEGNDRFARLAWIWGLIDLLLAFILWRGWRRTRRDSPPPTKSG